MVELDYSVSSGPFLNFEIEIGDGPGPKLDKNTLKGLKYGHYWCPQIIFMTRKKGI